VSGFKPHLEMLPAAQRQLWPLLAPTVEMGLVLYGGTAAALRLGHRTSLDFDFFTERAIDPTALEGELEFLKHSKVIQQRPNTLSVLAPAQQGEVKVSFFGDIGIGRVGTPELTQDGAVKVASLLDLLATKLKVILQRIEAKDYKDIAAILRAGEELDHGLAAATGMYSPNFQPSEALKALTYFGGGDLETLASSDRKYLIGAARDVRHRPIAGKVSHSLSSGS
jgi:Nucleotidyl transferase AbiEii toxin, Type IV TA system